MKVNNVKEALDLLMEVAKPLREHGKVRLNGVWYWDVDCNTEFAPVLIRVKDDDCACGGTKLEHSNVCKECL